MNISNLKAIFFDSDWALIIEDSTSAITATVGILKGQRPDKLFPNERYFNTFTKINEWLYSIPR